MPFLEPSDIAPNPTTRDCEDLLLRYFAALGARTEWSGPKLLRAELSRDQLCELENRPKGTWYVANHLPEISTLYLRLREGTGEAEDERAECGYPGSWRFELVRQSIRRIGSVTRLRIVPSTTDATTYRPLLVLGFEVAYRCSKRRVTLLPVAVDLVSGFADGPWALDLLTREVDERYVPQELTHKRELRFRHAYEVACEWVKDHIARDAATWDWYYRAQYRLKVELEQVEAFYGDRIKDEEKELERERDQAIAEVRRRFAPRIEARPVLAVMMLCPENELGQSRQVAHERSPSLQSVTGERAPQRSHSGSINASLKRSYRT